MGWAGMERRHGTCIALASAVGPLAVLLRGAPGTGKSDLALRLIDEGAWLIADDHTEIAAEDGRLLASAPENLAGSLEVRGFGIGAMPHLPRAPLALVVDLLPAAEIERLPDEAGLELLGVTVPLLRIDPANASAPARVRLALRARATALAPTAEAIARAESESAERRAVESGAAPRPIVLVTGLSGAGHTTALRVLEDIGYEAIDNLPLDLLGVTVVHGRQSRPLAIGVDIRNRDFAVGPFLEQVEALIANPRFKPSLLFVDCDTEVLERRFTATRRRHPLAQERPLIDGILAERRLLAPLRDRADLVLDSSDLSPTELGRLLTGHLGLSARPRMGVFVTSFSYGRGLPRAADLVVDARFLRNPHYVEGLRPLTGVDPGVGAYVRDDPAFEPFFLGLTQWLGPLLPLYEGQGKNYLTIAVGCTGGRHRSVYVAERLNLWLREQGRPPVLSHRELEMKDG